MAALIEPRGTLEEPAEADVGLRFDGPNQQHLHQLQSNDLIAPGRQPAMRLPIEVLLVGSALLLASGCAGNEPSEAEYPGSSNHSSAARVEPARPEPPRRSLEPLRRQLGLIAVGGAVFDSDHALWVETTGSKSAVDPTPVALSEPWHLGSNTKAMTATLFARLVEKRVCTWDVRVGDIWASGVHPAWRDLRLVDLLQHRAGTPSGLKDHFPDLLKRMWRPGADDVGLRAEYAGRLIAIAPIHPVGRYLYSNVGYTVVGAALERMTRTRWQDLMIRELFVPLQMRGCGFGAPPLGAAWGHRKDARGVYRPKSPASISADNPMTKAPAGGVYCDLQSYGAFVREHLRGALGQSQYLSQDSWGRLHSPRGNYALGWSVNSPGWAGGPALSHSGSNTLWYARTWIAPNLNRAFVAVTNVGSKKGGDGVAATISYLLQTNSLHSSSKKTSGQPFQQLQGPEFDRRPMM